MAEMEKFQCTRCGQDAYIGFSDWDGPSGKLIRADERLCRPCALARGVDFPFKPTEPLEGGKE